VIEAAKATLLVASQHERGAAMRAVLVHDREPALRVAPDDEVLAEEARANRRAVAFGNLLRHARRHPVATHEASHGRVALDAAEKIIVFAG
jgi:hypothetical protein